MKLIGIAGKAGVGKDTAAEHLCDNYLFQRLAFADPIKDALCAAFGLDREHFENREVKEELIDWIGKSPRQLAQLFGTEFGRDLVRDDIWLRRMDQAIKFEQEHHDEFLDSDEVGIVIPDVRFENEAEFVHERGGIIIHLWRDDAESVSPHISEQGIKVLSQDFAIVNSSSVEDLFAKLDNLMQYFGVQHV